MSDVTTLHPHDHRTADDDEAAASPRAAAAFDSPEQAHDEPRAHRGDRPRGGRRARPGRRPLGELHPRGRRPAARPLAPLPAARPGPGDRAGQAHRARRPRGQGASGQLQPAPRRLQRPPLSEPGPAALGPGPGGHARPDPRQREVRLAQGLPVLHLRHPVDPPGDPARTRELGSHHPPARARRPARAQGRAGRARAHRSARARADDRGGGRRDAAAPSSRSRRFATSAPRW